MQARFEVVISVGLGFVTGVSGPAAAVATCVTAGAVVGLIVAAHWMEIGLLFLTCVGFQGSE